jgi:hypothetical protein
VTDDLDKIIAKRLERILDEELHHLRREDVARGMRGLGFRWTANRVTQVVKGNRSISVLELAGICAVLRRPIAAILGDEGTVELPGGTVAVEDVWKALLGVPSWPAREDLSDDPTIQDEATLKAARRLGIKPAQVDVAAMRLWGRPLGEERDRRVGDQPVQGRRGHVTRALLAELETHLGEERQDGDRGGSAGALRG